jgi:hypothetical protein
MQASNTTGKPGQLCGQVLRKFCKVAKNTCILSWVDEFIGQVLVRDSGHGRAQSVVHVLLQQQGFKHRDPQGRSFGQHLVGIF